MRITYAPRDILQIDDARIIYRNFAGRGDKYNREGDRNFAVLIPDEEIADELTRRGWNVKVKFNDRGPSVYLRTGRVQNRLEEEDIGRLDRIDIIGVDLDIRPYDWEVNGKTGRTAYLQSICVTQDVDRFAEGIYPEG